MRYQQQLDSTPVEGRRFVEDGLPEVVDCSVAISHQQLKDLIVCHNRHGEYHFIGGKGLHRAVRNGPDSTYTHEFTRLDYVPNCISYGHNHIAVGGGKTELSLIPMLYKMIPSLQPIHTTLPYPASINNSLFVSHSAVLAPPLRPATGRTRPPWGGSEGMRVGVSNNDGTLRVLGVERNLPRRRHAEAEADYDARRKDVLTGVGEVELPVCVNHSSLSPDGRTLLSVGDSTKVYLHSVTNSGEAFRPIAVYTASLDASFSTAWSGDGRRFAVASQDGKISVWDHRSSHKLATLSTAPLPPSYVADLTISLSGSTRSSHVLAPYSFLTASAGASAGSGAGSGWANAARCVKFSPSGSAGEELLAFTDEFTSLYLSSGVSPSDDEKDILTLPTPGAFGLADRAEKTMDITTSSISRDGVVARQRLSVGTTGCGFSPCGGWVWGGTERAISEWKVRPSAQSWAEPRGGFL